MAAQQSFRKLQPSEAAVANGGAEYLISSLGVSAIDGGELCAACGASLGAALPVEFESRRFCNARCLKAHRHKNRHRHAAAAPPVPPPSPPPPTTSTAVQVGGGCASVAVTATVHGVRLVVQRRNIEEEWDQVMISDDPMMTSDGL